MRTIAGGLVVVSVGVLVGMMAACKPEKSSKVPFDVTAAFRNAATNAGSATAFRTGSSNAVTNANTTWVVSPDRVRMRVVRIEFLGPSGNGSVVGRAELESCEVVYDRSLPSLASLANCPFSIDLAVEEDGTGTAAHVSGLLLFIENTFDVLVDDPANGFFTDPSQPGLISTTEPAGGAQFVEFIVPIDSPDGTLGAFALLPQTFVLEPGAAPTLNLLMHGLHTMQILAPTGGTPTFVASQGARPVEIFPTLADVGKAVYYSASGTAGNWEPGTTGISWPPTSLFVFYAGTGAPSMAMLSSGNVSGGCTDGSASSAAFATSPEMSDPTQSDRAGGYLGIDSAGTLCFALPASRDYSSYAALLSMQVVTTRGGTTTIYCQETSTAPAPVSGNTYSSGCPTLTPTASATMTLVAD